MKARASSPLLACVLALSIRGSAAELRAGAGAAVITPPDGTPLAGYYSERGSEGVLDDLFAKAAVLDDGATRVALVACDLISLPRETVVEARRLIEKETGIPGGHVMISATHQHTGPVVAGESSLDELDGGASRRGASYTAKLPGLIAKAVADASAALVPARVSYAREEEHRLAFNRRFWMRDGTVGWNPGKLNPDILRPVGPIDPEVGVVHFEGGDPKAPEPLITYVNFAMHPDTTGGVLVSADFPGALSRALADTWGPDMLTIFANGACGELNHVNVAWPAPQKGPGEANRLGTILAAAVFKAAMDLKPVGGTALRVRSEIVPLPLAPLGEGDLAAARGIVKRPREAKFLDLVKAYRVIDVAARDGRPLEVEVQVIAMGRDLAWVSLPGEIFVGLGLSIKAASPFRQTHIAELANGSIGYIPDRSAYAQGNYEVVSARCAGGSGEMLVTAAIKMLKDLHEAAGH